MVNKNYVSGRAKEYRVKKKYEKEGLLCSRSAGSHSPFDLICIHRERKEIFFIQCKPKGMSAEQKRKLYNQYTWVDGVMQCFFVVE